MTWRAFVLAPLGGHCAATNGLVRVRLVRRNSNCGCLDQYHGLSLFRKLPRALDAAESENGQRNNLKFTFFIFSLFESQIPRRAQNDFH
jgi:hypothetical protein